MQSGQPQRLRSNAIASSPRAATQTPDLPAGLDDANDEAERFLLEASVTTHEVVQDPSRAKDDAEKAKDASSSDLRATEESASNGAYQNLGPGSKHSKKDKEESVSLADNDDDDDDEFIPRSG
ncbi:hypothetical protein VTO73DRAFT_4563 [Trametes versicolor]